MGRSQIFEHKIKPAIEESGCGYNCERYELRRANITKDILDELNNAHLVIADLTGSNPNVLWELGVRHTLSKRTILIAQDKKFLPSDLKDYPLITYKYKQTPAEDNRFRQEIKSRLKDIEADPDKPDSPVADFLIEKNIDLLSRVKAANLRKLDALLSELSLNIDQADAILKQVKEAHKEREKGERERSGTLMRFSKECLQLLVTTRYILLPHELFKKIAFINSIIGSVNNTLDVWPLFGTDIEKRLMKILPTIKTRLIVLLKEVNKVRFDYANDNYQEPKELNILLSSPEHKEYLKLTK